MLNHKTIFKQKSKSKIFITILCIFGLLFSYSCKCKNQVSDPNNIPLDNGIKTNNTTTKTNDKGGSVITPSMTLSTNLMIINVNGNDTKQKISITVDNADFEIADITSEVGLTKADFTLANGVLSLTKSFDKVDTTEKTLTLTVNYKKKSTAGANDTLSKATEKTTFKVIKAESVADDKLAKDLSNLLTIGDFKFGNNFAISSGIGIMYEKNQVDSEVNTGDFITKFKEEIVKSTDIEIVEDVDCIKVELEGNQTAIFSFILKVKEQYETTYNSADNPLKIKVVIGDKNNGQGGTGTWKDTFTTPQS